MQSHRLRLKLKEYYDLHGNHDSILIQISKGHYLPTFETATVSKPDLDRASASETVADVETTCSFPVM